MICIQHNPSRRQLAVFAAAWLVFFGILGGMSWWKSGSLPTACAFWAIGVLIPTIGLVRPAALLIFYLIASYATFPIGFLLSYVILAVVYYLVLTPIGIVLRLTGKDSMRRRFDRSVETYWTTREQDNATQRYFKQF